jgi:hypothetical protein
MAQMQALPTAVEVRLELAPIDAPDADHTSDVRQQTHVYRRVVRLPSALDEVTASAAAGGMGASSESGTGTGATGGTGGTGSSSGASGFGSGAGGT